jgi:hypothetical protein
VVLAPTEPLDDDQLNALMDKVRLQFMLGEEYESSETSSSEEESTSDEEGESLGSALNLDVTGINFV